MQDHQKIEQALEYIKNGHYRYDPDFPPLPDPPVLGESGHVIAHDRILDSLLYLKANPVMGGKILQVVRATDNITRSTTSTSYVDASISVTITPESTSSELLVVWTFTGAAQGNGVSPHSQFTITDNSNNELSGAQDAEMYLSVNGSTFRAPVTLTARDAPSTTSATTYKGKFRVIGAGCTAEVRNANQTGQMIAVEVRA